MFEGVRWTNTMFELRRRLGITASAEGMTDESALCRRR
jgi:hypothetical protein